MSPVYTRRDKRKKLKPRLSFGSSTGATANLPSNIEANLPELVARLEMQQQGHGDEAWYEDTGSVTGETARNRSSKRKLTVYLDKTGSAPKSAHSSQGNTALLDVAQGGDQVEEDQPLTEEDTADIVSHLRRVLQEYGPSQEEDLVKELEPGKARRVLAQHDTITSFLEHHHGFRQLHEDLHSFVYYEDPNDECYYTASSTVADLCDGISTLVLGAKNTGDPADSYSGHRSGRTSSCSSLSYETALEDVEEDERKVKSRKRECKDRWSQTPSRPRCRSQGMQAVPRTRNAEIQTQGWDPEKLTEMEQILKKRDTEISELHKKLESIQEDTAREMQELCLTIQKLRNELAERTTLQDEASQETGRTSSSYITEEEEEITEENEEETDDEEKENKNPEEVTTTVVESEEEEAKGGWPQEYAHDEFHQKSPLARKEPKEKLHARSAEPRSKQVPFVEKVKMLASGGPPATKSKARRNGTESLSLCTSTEGHVTVIAERPHVPEFYELHWQMEQAAASRSSRGGSPIKSKTEQQLAKIVQMVKKKLPNYTEQDIRRNVDYVRKSQGGFSRMTFNSIVALVLAHIKNNPR